MLACPRCHQPIYSQALTCPHCRLSLKAFGHPGIPLYRAEKDDFLCANCLYHQDDSCNFPQRPYAKECTLYHDHAEPLVPEIVQSHISGLKWIKNWCQRNLIWLILGSLILASVLLSL